MRQIIPLGVRCACVLVLAMLGSVAAAQSMAPVGMFENHQDVGEVLHAGASEFDAGAKSYTLSGSGDNMWAAKDAFQFAWKKASGDLTLTADISFVGKGTDPHRKACLLIRQSLDADSPYVDVALHGSGLTSLQWRESKGAATHEVESNLEMPRRLRIEKRGKYVRMWLAMEGQELSFSGAAERIEFQEPFYVGIGVCAHNKDLVEKAIFANVELNTALPPATGTPQLYSTLETQTVSSTDRRVTMVFNTRIEAPNWLKDGTTLIYNSGGRIYKIPAAGGKPEVIDTGFAIRCNNDHNISPDGTMLAISDQTQGRSRVYTVPLAGGTPKLITPTATSYFHGWSPDGKTLAYAGQRPDDFEIYTIPADGSAPETRLTNSPGTDDGPEYSSDGKYIYFNSVRTGLMQIWRMKPDGSEQEQVTNDQFNNWFAHPSPNNQRIVFISFNKDVVGHPENKDISIRIMTLATKQIDVLGNMFGGQGTANVPNWSPDGRKIAFVTYQLIN